MSQPGDRTLASNGCSRSCFLAAVLVAFGTTPALAHETLHEVQRGRAIAVKASFADGEVLAYTSFEIYSPADPKIPHQKGRTDRSGWLAFVPDAPGKWRVKVIDETGHGLDVEVDAEAPGTSAALAPGAPAKGASADPSGTSVASLAFVLRPLVGLAAICAVFAALFFTYRKTGTTP
jgi:nickel transport protein